MNQLFYYMRRMVRQLAYTRMIPKPLRRPIYTVSSLIGLLFFYNFILRFTNSKYLLQLYQFVYTIFYRDLRITTFFLVSILIFCIFSYRYSRYISTIISGCYLLIFVLGLMGVWL